MYVCMRITDGQMDDAQVLDRSDILTLVVLVHHKEVDFFFCLALVFPLALDLAFAKLFLHLLVRKNVDFFRKLPPV